MKRALLWFVAVLFTVGAVIYQRTTGPTYPFRGSFEAGGEAHDYRLIRSAETTRRARITLPDPGSSSLEASLHYKRFRTDDSLTVVPFARVGKEWEAYLPVQPAAGKMEYFVTVTFGSGTMRIPAKGEGNIILRYKDPVPLTVLLPHIVLMFFSVLVGIRAGLAAAFDPRDMRIPTFIALIGMTIGGMILGPIVQKYAFGAYWTGFPFGHDLTDNKTFIMWSSWVAAAAIIGIRHGVKDSASRFAVLAAAVVMTAVYLIPHSLRGSELDYNELDARAESFESRSARTPTQSQTVKESDDRAA